MWLLKAIVIISIIICTFVYFLTIRDTSATITICAENERLIVVIRSPDGRHSLHSQARPQDTLFCLGKALPFYEREIAYADISNQATTDLVSKRYALNSIQQDDSWSEDRVSRVGNILKLQTDEAYVVVGLRTIAHLGHWEETMQDVPVSAKTLFITPEDDEIANYVASQQSYQLNFEHIRIKNGRNVAVSLKH